MLVRTTGAARRLWHNCVNVADCFVPPQAEGCRALASRRRIVDCNAVVGGACARGNLGADPTIPHVIRHVRHGRHDCMNPANHLVQLAQSADGRTWSLVGGWQSYKGSVPDVFRRGNTLYVFSTSGLMRVDMTTGVTTTTNVTLSEGGFVDPSIAQLPDGRLILFYLPSIMGQDPAQCAQGESSCVRQIRSAVEVAGSDGSQFTVDAGSRVSETITSGSFSDPDIFYNGTEWVIYVSRGPSVHAYTSRRCRARTRFAASCRTISVGCPRRCSSPMAPSPPTCTPKWVRRERSVWRPPRQGSVRSLRSKPR